MNLGSGPNSKEREESAPVSHTTDSTRPVRIDFRDEAADSFVATLVMLCEQSLAVSLVLRSGEEMGAVLLSANSDVLVFEHWNQERGQPSGELGTVHVSDISQATVY